MILITQKYLLHKFYCTILVHCHICMSKLITNGFFKILIERVWHSF